VSIRFLADEDLKAGIVQGLRSREPAIDILDVKTAGLQRTKDPALLELAAQQGRIVITYDRRTMTRHFRDRLHAGKSSPGVFVFPQQTTSSVTSSNGCFSYGRHPRRKSGATGLCICRCVEILRGSPRYISSNHIHSIQGANP